MSHRVSPDENDPRDVAEIEARAAALGYGLHKTAGGSWALMRPSPVEDPFTARPLYLGPWRRLLSKIDMMENGPVHERVEGGPTRRPYGRKRP